METFEDFAHKIKSIFSADTVRIHYDNIIDINLSNGTHCATYEEIKELVDLLEYYDFKFSIHKDFSSGNPNIWIVWNAPKSPKESTKSNIPNDIPIDTRIGC